MALPDVTVTLSDGALGLQAPAADNVHVVLGACSAGTPGTLYSFTDIKRLVATLGGGPAVEAAAYSLSVAGGPVYVMPVTTSIAGSIGTVAQTGTGPAATVTGTPTDGYEPVINIVSGGPVGTATFQVALDASNPGGPTYGPVLTTSSTYAIPGTGLTVGFPTGTYNTGTTYAAPITAPGFNAGDLNAAFTALLGDPREWGFVHVVGQAASATASAAIAAVVATNMQVARNNYRYADALVEAATDTDANLLTAFASFASMDVVVAAGTEELVSPITGRTQVRPIAWGIAARASLAPISEDLAYVNRGAIPGVTKLLRDEQATPGLDAARFTTMRTIIGRQGFYITNAQTFAPSGSDYRYWHTKRVINRACKTARDSAMRFLNGTERINPDGSLYELDARAIESFVSSALNAVLVQPGHATRAAVVVGRDSNVLSTGTIPMSIRITPLGNVKTITIDIGLFNPATAAKVALDGDIPSHQRPPI